MGIDSEMAGRTASMKSMQRASQVRARVRGVRRAPMKVGTTVVCGAIPPPVETVTHLAASGGLTAALKPAADAFASLGVPPWLVKYGHPGNMAVVLSAMGGYGSLLGWKVRAGEEEAEVLEESGELHGKLMGAMTLFFFLGATGGILSEVMQDKPLFMSGHVKSGLLGLFLLSMKKKEERRRKKERRMKKERKDTFKEKKNSTVHFSSAGIQACLPLAFDEQPELRSAHAYLGTAIMALFVIHAGLGVQLALSL